LNEQVKNGHKSTACPACGWMVDVLSPVRGDFPAPAPGDITVCSRCKEILVYEEGMTLRKITEAEEKALTSEERMDLFRVMIYLATAP
jgi:hypothetical protein